MWMDGGTGDGAMHGGGDPGAGDRSRRRAVAALSTVAAANMALLAGRQLGLIRHLPDPPIAGFDADRVTAAPQSRLFGLPDAPFALAGLLTNLPIALAGDARRAVDQPWIPVAAAAKSISEAAIAGWYFSRMPTRIHAWCAYCIAGAAMNATIAALTIPEARRALPSVRPVVAGAIAAAALLGVGVWMAGRGRDSRPRAVRAGRATTRTRSARSPG